MDGWPVPGAASDKCGAWRTALLVILVCVLWTPARATLVRLTLTDGSVISGEIESVQGGIYTLRSASLGTLSVKESEILRMEMPPGSPARRGRKTTTPRARRNPRRGALS